MAECWWGTGYDERWTATWYYCGEGDRQRRCYWDYGTGNGEYVSSLSASANEYIEADDGQSGRCPWSVPWSTTAIHPTNPRNATTISTTTVPESLSTTPRTIPPSTCTLPASSPTNSTVPIRSVPTITTLSHTRLPNSTTTVPTTAIVADGVLCAAYGRRTTFYPL